MGKKNVVLVTEMHPEVKSNMLLKIGNSGIEDVTGNKIKLDSR